MKLQWLRRYPAVTWPVLAFTGAPASFPVQLENKDLQRCINWNNNMLDEVKTFIKETLPKGAFIGIHLRNGLDWVIISYICDYDAYLNIPIYIETVKFIL